MEAIAKHRFARTSAQKARLVADQVSGLPVDRALNLLAFSPKQQRSADSEQKEEREYFHRKSPDLRCRMHCRHTSAPATYPSQTGD